ncbi:MAG: hypothetical protein KatS3mg111_3333 [Pirellulaceae bacterium]|nr:MAG: hypothetical protein KatS3mg111_3333 [Pirellulaceae bacterium]
MAELQIPSTRRRRLAIWASTAVVSWGVVFAAVNIPPARAEAPPGPPPVVLPSGWQLVPAATKGLTHWPVVADWDSQGRLVVVESGGVARPIELHNEKLLHRIVRLVDTDSDGVFDASILAADRMPFTEGVLCLGEVILAAAPPRIWKLVDSDGDGYCEQREVWFDAGTITGCANDLHGPYLGRDGWVYWCKGAFAEQTHELIGGRTLRDRAAHIYRRRLDGGPLDLVVSGGMDNPIEVAMVDGGDIFFTSTFLVHPGNGQRDGIGHGAVGAVFGKPHGVLDDVPQTGPLMEPLVSMGPAAPSGLTTVASRSLQQALEALVTDSPSARTDAPWLLAALFNVHQITAHRLVAQGAGFSAQTVTLLSSDQVDFHPTDVLEDANGGVLVIDTGGWYDLCCPTSRVDQRVAGGGIYRLLPPGQSAAPESSDADHPRSSAAGGIGGLWRRMADPRPWIQRMALLEVMHGSEEMASELLQTALAASESKEDALPALWAGVARGGDLPLQQVHRCLEPVDSPLVQAACHGVGLHRYRPAVASLRRVALQGSGIGQRRAVEALGMIAEVHREVSAEVADTLMEVASHMPRRDGTLEHAIVYSLRATAATEQVMERMAVDRPHVTLLALRALRHMNPDQERFQAVLRQAVNCSDGEVVAETAAILAEHPPWAAKFLDVLDQKWRQGNSSAASLWLPVIDAWRDQPVVQQWVGDQLVAARAGHIGLPQLEPILRRWEGRSPPSAWQESIMALVERDPPRLLPLLAAWDLSGEDWKPLVTSLRARMHASTTAAERVAYLAALPRGTRIADPDLLRYVVEQGRWEILSKMVWSEAAARWALDHLAEAEPSHVVHWLRAIASADDELLDRQTLQRLDDLPVARTLPQGFLVELYQDRSSAVRELAKQIDARLSAPPADVLAEVQAVLQRLPPGDALRGLQVFRSSRAACSACHQLGYVGGRIGPELTHIGRSRTPEALLEAILFPSARIEQGFWSQQILTADGRVLRGLVVAEEGGRITLQTSADQQVTLERDEIVESRPSATSIMPAGLGEVLTPQQLADLLALLQNAR